MGELFWEIPSPVSFLSPPARVWNKLNTLTLSRMILHNPPPFGLFFVCCKNKLCVFKTLKAFFRLKATIYALMPSQWISGAPHPWCCTFLVFVAQLEKFWQWPTFHINQLHGSDTAIEISRAGPKYADDEKTRSLGVDKSETHSLIPDRDRVSDERSREKFSRARASSIFHYDINLNSLIIHELNS